MVLQELGSKITDAFKRLQSTTVVNQEIVDAMIQDVAR